jgi:hypothetical protein
LQSAGLSSAASFTDVAERDLVTLSYVLWIPGTPPSATTARLLDSSLSLAVFGNNAASPSVRQVFPSGLRALRPQQMADSVQRKSAGSELTRNPRITPDSAAERALTAGTVDLRAENVVNILSIDGHTWLSIDAEDDAEQRADLPARTITVTVQNPSAVQVSLAALTPPFRPSAIETVAANKFRLTWSPDIVPVTIAGG